MEIVRHTLEPVYDAHSRILLLGSIPSPKSRETGFYYGHPRNRFWPVLEAVLHEKIPFSPDGKRELLLRRGIALWDVLQSCEIKGAEDGSIRQPEPNNLSRILEQAAIRAIFTTGTKAAALYRRLCFPQTGREAIPLPSTSPANCACSFEELCRRYRVLLPYLEGR
ncbi:MAG: DNA-deoxyinosine glycosylase [Provencibacterium sp.]|nr:DNA-deoxyinosine glycosylase [Provencibacterium sp.]